MVVIQPAVFPSPEDISGSFEAINGNSYILINERGGYELYIDNQSFGELKELVPDLPIYYNEEFN